MEFNDHFLIDTLVILIKKYINRPILTANSNFLNRIITNFAVHENINTKMNTSAFVWDMR